MRSEVIFDEADPEQTPTEKEPEFENAKPLAEEIIDTLIDLLFFSDFTLPKVAAGKNKVTYAIWQSGVGCNTPIASTKEFESNRTEILRLLLTLASKSMYMSAGMHCPVLYNRDRCADRSRYSPSKGRQGHYVHCDMSRQTSRLVCSLLALEHSKRICVCYYCHTLTLADTQVQPRHMARAIRSRRF